LRFRSLFIVLQEHEEPIIRVAMLVLMLLFAFTAVAFPVDDDPSEDDDGLDGDAWGTISVVTPFASLSFVLALASGFIAMVLVPEYLSSHIGEKRFADVTLVSPLFTLLFGCLVTALFVVPSLFYSGRHPWNSMSGRLAVFRYCATSPYSLDEGICNKRRY